MMTFMDEAALGEAEEYTTIDTAEAKGLDPRLVGILTMLRPNGSEDAVAKRFLSSYEPTTYTDDKGAALAYEVVVKRADGTASDTLFSCHLDTVSRSYGTRPISFDAKTQLIHSVSGPLGADDGAGVWLMLEMIDAGVPGTYLFHVGEECGGIGSKGMADFHPHQIAMHARAVAFDRRGVDSVITHQGFGRGCSDKFAQSLAEALNSVMVDGFFAPDDTGIYTDTAEYTGLIGECTNIACGYDKEHTDKETLDYEFLLRLRDAVCCVSWDGLPSVRKAGEQDPNDYGGLAWRSRDIGKYGTSPTKKDPLKDYEVLDRRDVYRMTTKELRKWVSDAPIAAIVDTLFGIIDEATDEIDELKWQLDLADGMAVREDE